MVISKRSRSTCAGWTLIELTIVLSLVVILSTLALVGYRNAVTRSREAVLKEDLFRMREAIDQYYADRQSYPATLDSLVESGYLRAIPVDPFTSSSDTWQAVLSEFQADDLFQQGIYDVKTSYDGLAIDGSVYADW